jgi:hypothetical protein
MATISSKHMTLYDHAKGRDPSGKAARIAELLGQTNDVLMDMVYKEGNLPTGEQVTVRTGLPTVYYRLTNQGVPESKSTKAQLTEQASILEGRSQIDVDIASLDGDVNATRQSEDEAFMESMNQTQSQNLIYGDGSSPEKYVGLAPRYSDLSANNAQNILDAGGTGSDNTSVWLIGWSTDTVYGTYPKGSSAGLSMEDLGVQDAFDENDNRFRAYMSLHKWKQGLVVKDWRYAVRIANIDISDLEGLTGTQAVTAATALTKMMSRAIDRLPSLRNIKPSFYANRSVLSLLRVMAQEKSSSAVTIEPATTQFGQTIDQTRFLRVPVGMVDQILNNEARVV